MKNIYLKLLEIQSTGSGLVLATVTGSAGSTPQKPGCSALFDSNGLITGTVGGGIVEGKVMEFAVESSRTKESGYLHLLLDKDISDTEEAICGGEISVLVDANPHNHLAVFSEMEKSLAEKDPGILITMVTVNNEKQVLVNRYWMTMKIKPDLPEEFMTEIEPAVIKILSSYEPDNYRQLELSIPGEEPSSLFFLEPVFPMLQLIIAGAGHIGKALSHLGKMLDFEVSVIDDRMEYANADALPDADHIIVNDIGEALQKIEKNSDTFVVIVTRGHNDDAKALKPCIGSDAAYVGMIGSKGKVAKMHADFIQKGWATEEQWGKIYTPVGLDIKSRSVEEIAISIAAQLVLVKNSRRK